jgi:hypothetical protein
MYGTLSSDINETELGLSSNIPVESNGTIPSSKRKSSRRNYLSFAVVMIALLGASFIAFFGNESSSALIPKILNLKKEARSETTTYSEGAVSTDATTATKEKKTVNEAKRLLTVVKAVQVCYYIEQILD